MPISNKFTLRRFRATRRGRYWGEAIFELPSGAVRRLAVFRDSGIYFGPVGGEDAELFTGGGLEREQHVVMPWPAVRATAGHAPRSLLGWQLARYGLVSRRVRA